jgi:hypothetical protein
MTQGSGSQRRYSPNDAALPELLELARFSGLLREMDESAATTVAAVILGGG